MGQLQSRVERLRNELRLKVDTATLTHADVRELTSRTADLLLRALGDEGHPLYQMLRELTQMIDVYSAPVLRGKKSSRASSSKTLPLAPPPSRADPDAQLVMSDRQFFLPQPGISHAAIRQFWPLQLLLYVTGHSEQQEELARHLAMSTQQLKQAVSEAEQPGVGTWSMPQFGQHLYDALQSLDYPDPPVCVRLDGRFLIHGSTRVRLSKLQVCFIRLLIQRIGQWVEFADFHQGGVLDPKDVKHKLLKKLQEHDIVLLIDSRPGAYRLPEATS
jgi:hypothetical protein